MNKYLDYAFDRNDPELLSIIDDLPLWSAPFGLMLLDMVRLRTGMNALDIGHGLGFPMLELAQRLGTTSTVYGIDPWESALERVKLKIQKLGLTNVTVVRGMAEKLPFEDGFFDLIVSNNGLNNVESIEAALSECRRVCRTAAQMVLTMNLPGTMREFYDIYRTVLRELGKAGELRKIEDHIHLKRKPLKETESQLAGAGFAISDVRKDTFRMRFANGTAMFNHFLIRLAFLKPWTDILVAGDVQTVFSEIEQRLNALAEKQGGLILTIPYVCIDCARR